MTDIATLVDVRVGEGEFVRVTQAGEHLRVNTSQYLRVEPAMQLRVTRIFNDSVMVRTVAQMRVPTAWGGGEMRVCSFTIDKHLLTLWDESAPRPRKLGQKPEDTEEMTYIDVNDPRLKWIWEDLGAYAEGKNWCSEYDQLCARIGIPGRPRDFSIEHVVGGISIRATVKAHSQREANDIVKAALAQHLPEEQAAIEPAENRDFALAG